MLKYYCEHCKTLYNGEMICTNCGLLAKQRIWIEVQEHKKNSHLDDDYGEIY